MNCRAVQRELWPLLDGALKPEQRAVVEQHLAACAACRAELERARVARGALGALAGRPQVDLEAAWGALEQRLHTQPERPAPRRWAWWLLPVPVAAAAAAGAAVALVVSLSPGAVSPAGPEELEVARHMELLKHLDCFREYDSLEAAGLLEDPAALEAALEEVGG